MTAQVRIGCSGWVYKHWKGIFYPSDIKPADSRWAAPVAAHPPALNPGRSPWAPPTPPPNGNGRHTEPPRS